MKAKISPLRLEHYGVDNIAVRSNESHAPGTQRTGEPCPRIEVRIGEADERGVFPMVLGVHIEETAELDVPIEQVPYFLDIEVVGFFSIGDGPDEKEREWLRGFNAPAILYGLARAELAHLTEHNRFGSFILPSVDFIAMAREAVGQVRETRSGTGQGPEGE